MTPIKTKDCYLSVEEVTGFVLVIKKQNTGYQVSTPIQHLEKHTGMVVLTVTELQNIINEAEQRVISAFMEADELEKKLRWD